MVTTESLGCQIVRKSSTGIIILFVLFLVICIWTISCNSATSVFNKCLKYPHINNNNNNINLILQ